MGTKSTTFLLTLVLILAILGVGVTRTRSVEAYAEAMTFEERYYLPSANWLRAMSLGYNEAAAALIWLKTIIYFGGSFQGENQSRTENHTVNYLKTALELNPHVRTYYTTGAAVTLFQNGGIVSEATVKMSIELLEMGTEVFPNDGEIFFTLGFNHYYEMRPFMPKDPEDPKRKYHNETGTRYIRMAATMDRAPPYAAMVSLSLQSKHGLAEMTIRHLQHLLLKETDREIREALKQRLREELGKAAERDIVESERLVRKWKSEFPFVPYDLYLILKKEISIDALLDPLYESHKRLGLDETDSLRPITDGASELANDP